MEGGDCSYLLKNRDPSQILRKAIVLLEHQVTRENVERQLKIIDQYINVSKDGFLVRDLGSLMYLFELLRNRIAIEQRFEDKLTQLLSLCFIPPRIVKSSDVLEYALDIQELFSWLGYMVAWLTNINHKIQALEALHSLLTVDYPSKRYYLSLAVRKERAHNSLLADILGDLMEFVEENIYVYILKVVQVFCENSKKTCIQFLKKGTVSTLIVRMEPRWKKRFPSLKPEVPTGTEEILHADSIFQIFILLLEHASAETMRAPTKYTLWSLQWAFRLYCIKETTNLERNNILAILLVLLDVYPDLLSGNLTLSYDVAMLAMSRDIIFHPNWTSDITLTTSNEDHSCMALLLMCISYFPNCLSGPKVIEECRIVMGLLKLIGHQQAIKWNQLQACYLIRLALNILQKVVPASTEEFIEDGGPLTIIQLLNKARGCKSCYNYDIVFRSVELLSHFSFKFESVRDSVAYNGGVECIIPLLEDYLNQSYLSQQIQHLIAAGICLLDQICSTEEELLVIPLVITYMKRYINPSQEDPVQTPKLIIVVLSFIWNRVTSSYANSKVFVNKGGVYLILDVMQISCLPVKLVALGTLIDLCELVECVPYLITWRKNGQRIKSLLADIFRQENKELLVRVNNHGIIQDSRCPIMGKFQFYATFCPCKKDIGNPSIADMFVSCRPKVYCLLQILNCKQVETVEIVDEFYNLYSEDLSALDEVTLLLAENFLALKLAEQWRELETEFEKLEMEPILFDAATISAMIKITNHWGVVLQKMQYEVLHKHQVKESYKEQELYTKIRDACLADAWDAISQMKYMARCSERLFRITSTFKVQTQITKSLNVDRDNGQMHRTLQSNISVSCLRNQDIDVPTDVYEESPKGPPVPEYASPVSSVISLSNADCCEQESEYMTEDTFLSKRLLIESDSDPPADKILKKKLKTNKTNLL